jgi:hypothetical protein
VEPGLYCVQYGTSSVLNEPNESALLVQGSHLEWFPATAAVHCVQ